MTDPVIIQGLERRIRSLHEFLNRSSIGSHEPSNLDRAIDRICAAAIIGNVKEANAILHGPAFAAKEQRATVQNIVNELFFFPQEKEWNLHGAPRTFRFWSSEEKQTYLRRTCDVVETLESVSPMVSIGFGAVLAYLRDKDFIPHDDDLDLVIAFDRADCPTLSEARQRVRFALESKALKCSGNYLSHWNVFFSEGHHIDVFVGLVEEDRVSFFPSARKNLLVRNVFPAVEVEFFGVGCKMPSDIENYVSVTYGQDWRSPIPNWNHPWNKDQYKDIL